MNSVDKAKQLVGTGTAVAAAASGFVFGQPSEARPSYLPNNELGEPDEVLEQIRPTSFRAFTEPVSRPGTTSAIPRRDKSQGTLRSSPSRPPLSRYQRPSTSQLATSNVLTKRRSSIKQGILGISAAAEGSRDSFSSTNSWIKRLSARPLSQHESIRSLSLFDSPSVTFSHGSAAPILGPSALTAPLPPNKLVKRTPSTSHTDPVNLPRRRSKSRSHMPILRRPATSHQRSATLQQISCDSDPPGYSPRYSFDRPLPQDSVRYSQDTTQRLPSSSSWTSYFHAQSTRLIDRAGSIRRTERSRSLGTSQAKRVHPGGRGSRQVHLVKPRMVSATSEPPFLVHSSELSKDITANMTETKEEWDATPNSKSSKHAQRSISTTFTSAGDWVSRTQGSLRRANKGSDPKSGKRHVSDSVIHTIGASEKWPDVTQDSPQSKTSHTPLRKQTFSLPTSRSDPRQNDRHKPASPPMRSLPRHSSFHLDLSRPDHSHITPPSRNLNGPRSTRSHSHVTKSSNSFGVPPPRVDEFWLPTGSDHDARGFASGEDDDTDVRSDNAFDSVRTSASGRARTVETPLDSMYDDSPPNTASNRKKNRLSIQEMLDIAREEQGEYMMPEEDSAITPGRSNPHIMGRYPGEELEQAFNTEVDRDDQEAGEDFGRLSMDDDFDEDWTRDDETPFKPLSPPSKGSPLSSKGMNPNVRLALANISGNGLVDVSTTESQGERSLEMLFDWSEAPAQERQRADGSFTRPHTARTKHESESRGGRSSVRRPPVPTHVRSQSVPAAQDGPDGTKPSSSKYGTWAMGTKPVSEDWGDDFEFGGNASGGDTQGNNRDLFAVPESIRASQPSVKAHSGQIREFSLLVNDLKRLCRHGREMDMLDGPYRGLWKEAEGIIALASPDEDDFQLSNGQSNYGYGDGFDTESLSQFDLVADGRELDVSKTAVVRERPSPRRRSVFSPDDDIFGCNLPVNTDSSMSKSQSRPRTPEPRTHDVLGAVKSVIEVIDQRATLPLENGDNKSKPVHFDTTSLRALVKRAGDLRDMLSETIRKVDQIMSSPIRTPRYERNHESSPAFTRVFDEPGSSPPRKPYKSRNSKHALRETTSPDKSPKTSANHAVQALTAA